MSRKRGAAYQLTDSNWDQEEPEGDSDDEVKIVEPETVPERKIKKAVRRSNKKPDQEGASSNLFQGFTGFKGFGSTTSNPPIKPTIPSFGAPAASSEKVETSTNFWAKASEATAFFNPSAAKPKVDVTSESSTKGFSFLTNSTPSSGGAESGGVPNGKHDKKPTFGMATVKSPPKPLLSTTGDSSNSKYVDHIISLNVCVLSWIKQHIDDNPCIDLTPVFKDYELHMSDIEKKFGSGVDDDKDTKSTETAESTKVPDPQISPVSDPLTKKVAFFSPPTDRKKDSGAVTTSASPIGSGFFASLASSTPLPQTKVSTETTTATEEEDESPPKEERKTIVEDDAFFTSRSKLFYKKGDGWQELGVGMLYLKPMGEKTQLLVRMETATGKILLNICLSPLMPVNRTGKNNVTLLTIPNPPVFVKPADGDNSKPVTYLIRVKGATEADSLFDKIVECKGKEA